MIIETSNGSQLISSTLLLFDLLLIPFDEEFRWINHNFICCAQGESDGEGNTLPEQLQWLCKRLLVIVHFVAVLC